MDERTKEREGERNHRTWRRNEKKKENQSKHSKMKRKDAENRCANWIENKHYSRVWYISICICKAN